MKKNTKTKSSQTKASANQDIVGLITTLVEKLVSLETKMDTVLSRLQVQHAQPHRRDSMPQAPRALPVNTRPMYSAVCADCGSKCEVPFKPSAGRSVYCKGCYSARRNNGSSAPRADMRSKEAVPTPAFNAPVAAKKKPAAKKAKKKA